MSTDGSLSTQEITLALRDSMESVRKVCGHESASHAFASLFLWQRDMGLSVCLRENAFAVRCGHRGEGAWFFPCGEETEAVRFVRDILDVCPHARFLYLRRADAELLEKHFPGRFSIERADGASEYLFDRDEYVDLPGEKNRSIRWSINRLINHHDLRTELIDPSVTEDVRAVLSAWKPSNADQNYSYDHSTASLLLENYSALDVTGVIVYMDGSPAAAAIGFPLSERSFDIAFSKAPVRATGLLHYSRRQLVHMLPDRYTVINGEEDLGLPGLRKAKTLEHPVGMIDMFEAYAY